MLIINGCGLYASFIYCTEVTIIIMPVRLTYTPVRHLRKLGFTRELELGHMSRGEVCPGALFWHEIY